jgi:hypothetical protein
MGHRRLKFNDVLSRQTVPFISVSRFIALKTGIEQDYRCFPD